MWSTRSGDGIVRHDSMSRAGAREESFSRVAKYVCFEGSPAITSVGAPLQVGVSVHFDVDLEDSKYELSAISRSQLRINSSHVAMDSVSRDAKRRRDILLARAC